MQRVIELKIRIVADPYNLPDDVDDNDFVNELDYYIESGTEGVKIKDNEIIDFEIIE